MLQIFDKVWILGADVHSDMGYRHRDLPELYNFSTYFTLRFSFPSMVSFSLPRYQLTAYLSLQSKSWHPIVADTYFGALIPLLQWSSRPNSVWVWLEQHNRQCLQEDR
jgi:hypothetical protein